MSSRRITRDRKSRRAIRSASYQRDPARAPARSGNKTRVKLYYEFLGNRDTVGHFRANNFQDLTDAATPTIPKNRYDAAISAGHRRRFTGRIRK